MADGDEATVDVQSTSEKAPSAMEPSVADQSVNSNTEVSESDAQTHTSPDSVEQVNNEALPSVPNQSNESGGSEKAEETETVKERSQSALDENAEAQRQTNDTVNKQQAESKQAAEISPTSKAAKTDIDRDSRNPAFVPRSGRFFEHDDRNDDGSDVDEKSKQAVQAVASSGDARSPSAAATAASHAKSEVSKADAARRSRADASSRWAHDLFDAKQQEPRSGRRNQDTKPRVTPTNRVQKAESSESGAEVHVDYKRGERNYKRPQKSAGRGESQAEDDEPLAYDDLRLSDQEDSAHRVAKPVKSHDDVQEQRTRPRRNELRGRANQTRPNYGPSTQAYDDTYVHRPPHAANGNASARGRNANGGASRSNRPFVEYEYADDYHATRARPAQSKRFADPADCYYDDPTPADARATLQSRNARGARTSYTARNKSGIDADRWTHDRADVLSTPTQNSARPSQRANAAASYSANTQRVTTASATSNSRTGQPQPQTKPAARPTTSNSDRHVRVSNSETDSHSRNAPKEVRAKADAKVTHEPYNNNERSYNTSNVSVAQSSYPANSNFYDVAPTQPTPNSLVTPEQLNVLFDAFSAATAQFAPTVSNQILQTVAHTLMMHGNASSASVDPAQPFSNPDAYTLAANVPVGVGVTPLISVPVMPANAIIASGSGYMAHSDGYKPAFNANATAQPRRTRAPLQIVNPKDLPRRNDTTHVANAGNGRSDAR